MNRVDLLKLKNALMFSSDEDARNEALTIIDVELLQLPQYKQLVLPPYLNDPTKTMRIYLLRDDGRQVWFQAIQHSVKEIVQYGEEIIWDYKNFIHQGIANELRELLFSKLSDAALEHIEVAMYINKRANK